MSGVRVLLPELMTKITEIDDDWVQIHVIPCDCKNKHYLQLMIWKDDIERPEAYLSLEDTYYPESIKDRVKTAWKALRGKSICHSEVILTPDSVESLKQLGSAVEDFWNSNPKS